MQLLQGALVLVILATLAGSVFFSFRHRRQTSRKARGIDAAKMNMCMGVMLVAISLVQLLLFTGSSIRVVVGAAMLLLGLFNLFAGIRNYGVYSRVKE